MSYKLSCDGEVVSTGQMNGLKSRCRTVDPTTHSETLIIRGNVWNWPKNSRCDDNKCSLSSTTWRYLWVSCAMNTWTWEHVTMWLCVCTRWGERAAQPLNQLIFTETSVTPPPTLHFPGISSHFSAQTWSFPDDNQVVFVPKPKHVLKPYVSTTALLKLHNNVQT